MDADPIAWHVLDPQAAVARLQSDAQAGLSGAEAADRLARHGANAIEAAARRSKLAMLATQFADVMILLLVAAAVVSGVIGEIEDTIVILCIVVLNAAVGFVQEYRAEKAMAALQRMAAPHAVVVRDGRAQTVAADELVPGDIVLLEAGNLVPADLRLLQAVDLRLGEAALTGESLPVDKAVTTLGDPALPVADRTNLAFKGTLVQYGRGRGLVVATGMQTELGRIARLLQGVGATATPLQRRLAALGRQLAMAALAICALIFGLGLLRGEAPLAMLLTALSLAVAAIPEALPAVVTVLLALGAARMVRAQALIRRLPAVETLGSVTVICSDKTGTLTRNEMRAVAAFVGGARVTMTALPDDPAAGLLLRAMALCNDVERGPDGAPLGDPTEVALFVAAAEAGWHKTDPRVLELPFDSDRKLMTTLHPAPPPPGANRLPPPTRPAPVPTGGADLFPPSWPAPAPTGGPGLVPPSWPATEPAIGRGTDRAGSDGRDKPGHDDRGAAGGGPDHASTDGFIAFTKGAPEMLLPRCRPAGRQDAAQAAEAMAGDGLRVLAVACRRWDALPARRDSATLEQDLTLLGLVGLVDPPRDEAKRAVATCHAAGIEVVMITGDHPVTARAIARQLGILDDDGTAVLTGRELADLSDDALRARAGDVRVYARVDPAQKIRIVEALQARGEIVAMTGDGVNDAPALARAEIGVAMGKGGTDVARESASLVLLDDNFATIVAAVHEGRRIYDNIRKFIRFVVTCNSAEIWTIFLAPLFGMPVPLLPIQILWINLVTDGLPGLALAAEPAERDIMQRPPRSPQQGLLGEGMALQMAWVGLLMGGITLATQAGSLWAEDTHWQTMVFTVLTLSQMAQVLAIRSERESLFRQGLLSNKPLLGAVLLTFALQLMVIYVPLFNPIFRTEPLSFAELLVCIGLSGVVFVAVELDKLRLRRSARRRLRGRWGASGTLTAGPERLAAAQDMTQMHADKNR